ncbi:hypothetical protein, partial [Novosphingobium endophyticum]|uniref:hypothetical protein n=1 Tax=Novosphingobium endophyticum TaxID=1955250 RepID=UPI001E372CBC
RTPIAAAITSLRVPVPTNHNLSSLGIPDVSQPLRAGITRERNGRTIRTGFVGERCSRRILAFMAEIEIAGVARIAGLVDVVSMICCHQHKGQVRDIGTSLQPGNVLEDVVPVVGFAVVFSLEELQLDRAAPFAAIIICKTEPHVDPAPFATIIPQWLLEFDRKRFTLADDLEVRDRGDYAAKMQLQGGLNLTSYPPTAYLTKKRRHSQVHDIPEAQERHVFLQTNFSHCHNVAILTS